MNDFSDLHDCTFKTIFKFYLTLIFLLMQRLIISKDFDPFLHFLFLIKNLLKSLVLSLKKDQRKKVVSESSFLYFWKKNELCIIYDMLLPWNQGQIQGKIKQQNIWRKIDFSQKKSKLHYLYAV